MPNEMNASPAAAPRAPARPPTQSNGTALPEYTQRHLADLINYFDLDLDKLIYEDEVINFAEMIIREHAARARRLASVFADAPADDLDRF